jgi:hypothetical protein
MEPTNHFSLDTLDEFFDGQLSPRAQADISSHLNTGCPECSERMNFLRRFRRAGQTESWPLPPRSVHRRAVQLFRPTVRQLPRRLQPGLGPVLSAVFAVVIIIIGMIWLAAPPAANAASIREVSGQVEFRVGSQADWRLVGAGQKLLPGSEIRTFANSQVTLVFPNVGRMQLSENSHVVLDSMTHLNKLWQIALLQDTGQTDSLVNPGTGIYQLRTPSGDITANGTRFDVSVESDGKTLINVLEGSVTATTDAGEISIEAGQSAQIALDEIPMIATSTTSSDTPTLITQTFQTASDTPTFITPTLQTASETQTVQFGDTPTPTTLPTQTEVNNNEENQDSHNSSDGDGQHP